MARIRMKTLRWFAVCLSLAVLVAIGGGVTSVWSPAAEASLFSDLKFLIWRDGKDIGRHQMRFRRDGGKLIVEGSAEIEVKAWFLTIFTFRQILREEWENGRLIRFYSSTYDDGRKYQVEGRATAAGFAVANNEGRFVAPAHVLPASYWHPKTPDQNALLDPKTGRLLKVRFKPKGYERVETANGTITSKRYEGDGDVRVTLWYDSNQLLAQAFYHAPEDGSLIKYQRRTPAAAQGRASR